MNSPLRAALLGLAFLTLVPAAEAGGQQAPATADDQFVSPAPREPLSPAAEAALASLGVEALAAHVRLLAAPSLGGRGLGGRGLEAALDYVAASLALAGVPPLPPADGAPPTAEAYFQPVPVRQLVGPTGTLRVEWRRGSETRQRLLAPGVDAALPALPPGSLAAPVVFAGFGICEPALGRDDYRGLDVRGRAVLVLAGLPPGPAWQTDGLRSRHASPDREERFLTRLEAAREAGATLVLVVEAGEETMRVAAEGPAFLPVDGPPADAEPPLVRLSAGAGDSLLAAAGLDGGAAREASPRPLPGVTVTLETRAEERLVVSRNVIGVLAGSDPARAGEAVVLGAHLDHLGEPGGVLHPGADDNASGVAALLEIARAFARGPRPRRTLVFAFWTGEEEGRLGSDHYVRHPRWPLGRTAAYLNLDMIGHPWLGEEIRKLVEQERPPGAEAFLRELRPAEFAEPGIASWAPELAGVLRRAGRATGLWLRLDRTDGRRGGSDYRGFARAGVPFVRFFGNFFPGYHAPGDTAAGLDAGQVQRLARLAFATAHLLAEADDRPPPRR